MSTMQRRLKAARAALRAFQKDPGQEQGFTKEALTDLITDLYLLGLSHGIAMEAVSFSVSNHYDAEKEF